MRRLLSVLGIFLDEDVDWLLAVGRRQRVPPGTVLIAEGAAVEDLLLILDGSARVTVSRANPRELARCGAGELLGEVSFVDARAATATVTAERDPLVLRIPRPAVTARLGSDPAFAARFYKVIAVLLAQRLRHTIALLEARDGAPLSAGQGDPDELDPEALENLALAGARSDWMLKRLKDGSPEPS
jgi:CRP-like cAMP-binding protein